MAGSKLARQAEANVAARAGQPTDAETQVRALIKDRLSTIRALLPEVLDERKLAALVITEVHKTPALATCDEATLVGCVLRAAALGLQFGQDLGEAYLIPRRNQGKMECTLQLGYRGIIRLAERSGRLKSITTRAVYEGDRFDYAYGLEERLDHVPAGDVPHDAGGERGPLTHAYAIARYTNGGHDWEVLTRAQCLARKARGKGAQPAWQSDFAKMCEKSALLAMRARLPLTTEVATALAQDGAAITVSSRGPAALVADHGEPAALPAAAAEAEPPEPERQVDSDGVVTREPEATPPAPEQPTDVAAVLNAAGINPPLHLAVIAKASQGRTTIASELDQTEAHNLAIHARTCAAGPEGFVRNVLTRMVDGEEKATLQAWLDEQAADPS